MLRLRTRNTAHIPSAATLSGHGTHPSDGYTRDVRHSLASRLRAALPVLAPTAAYTHCPWNSRGSRLISLPSAPALASAVRPHQPRHQLSIRHPNVVRVTRVI